MNTKCAVLLAGIGLAACTPGERPPGGPVTPGTPGIPGLPGLPATEPAVRVGIAVDTARIEVRAASAWEIRDGDRVIARVPAGETWTFTADGSGRIAAGGPGGRMDARSSPVQVVSGDGRVMIGARPYRGGVLVLPRGANALTAVNVVDLEAYLLGVVPREIGRRPASEIEAMKAQAVAARTYAVGNLNGRGAQGFDFYATVLDQVYGGIADEDTIVSRAVRETRGEILVHNGRPILAYYSSTCGGSTANIEDSWPDRTPLPYLRGVSDRIPGTDEYYCGTSNRFRWSQRWTRAQLLDVLAQTLRTHTRGNVTQVSRIDDVALERVNASERATVRLVADGRDYTLRADSLRWVLRPQPGPAILNSSRLYDVHTERDGDGVSALEIHGGGWGHAIGMCQVGAMGRARAGHSYSQILRAYYTGAELRRLY